MPKRPAGHQAYYFGLLVWVVGLSFVFGPSYPNSTTPTPTPTPARLARGTTSTWFSLGLGEGQVAKGPLCR